MSSMSNTQIRLASRPTGWVTAENFEVTEEPVPEAGDGQVLVRNVFMSVDPGRDSPEKIHRYINGFGDRFTGITGDGAVIDDLASALGAPFFVDDAEGAYTVDHSSALFLIDPSASYAGVISQPLDIDAVVRALNGLL